MREISYPQPDRIEPSWKMGYNACIDDILKGADDNDSNTINGGWIPCEVILPEEKRKLFMYNVVWRSNGM